MMANGRTFEGIDTLGNTQRFVIEQSEYGYSVLHVERRGFNAYWDAPEFLGEFDSSQAARKSIDTSAMHVVEDWYSN